LPKAAIQSTGQCLGAPTCSRPRAADLSSNVSWSSASVDNIRADCKSA
jgi:hypothetical protein